MQYTKNFNYLMFGHLQVIGNMIRDLRNARVDLADKQQVLILIARPSMESDKALDDS